MSLTPGTRLGPYQIVAAIGAGGMGEVYRARDTQLNRDVAIKVLPELFAADPERLARFTREAQTLAALNHPNIAAIYGIEGTALVMELVEGEDLSAIIARGPLPPADALPIARQLADALEAAHELGIVHRDLKPANIKVRADGTVKVLDFGLAKAMDPGGGPNPSLANSPTLTAHATAMGIIVGTAAYMAPEQARGRAVDRRADLWAFGAVLYEMLTGRQAFAGDTITDVLAAVVKEPPDWSRLPADMPAPLRRLLERCLEKDVKRRMRDAGDARLEIEEVLGGAAAPSPTRAAASPPRAPRASGGRMLVTGVAVVAVAAIAAAAGWMLKPAPGLPLRKFAIRAADGARIVDAAISPDGRAVVFLANDKMWVQRLDSVNPQEMPGVTDVHALFWSSDSAMVGFQTKGQLWKIPAAGGSPTPICRVPREFSSSGGAVWLADDRIVFTTGGSGLMEVSALGGEPHALLAPDLKVESDLHQVSALPQAKGFLFVPHLINQRQDQIDLFDGASRREIFRAEGRIEFPVYAPPGYILFTQDSGVWAVKYSLADGKVAGAPFLVAPSGVRPTAADDGTIALVTDEIRPENMQLCWVDHSGTLVAPAGRVGRPLLQPRLSPDGRMVVGTVIDNAASDLWVLDLDRHTERRLTYEPGNNTNPRWSPDGKHVVYSCDAGVCSRPADGTGQPIVLVPKPAHLPALSPDGSALLFVREQAVTSADIFIAPLGPKGVAAPPVGEARPFVAAERMQTVIEVSPDGRYAAYDSNETGVHSVYVTEFPSGRGKWQVGAGQMPRWNGRGDRLYINVGGRIVEFEVTTTPSLSISEPHPLFAGEAAGVAIPGRGFQPSADGTRFLVNRSATAASNTAVMIVQNWFAEFAAGKKP